MNQEDINIISQEQLKRQGLQIIQRLVAEYTRRLLVPFFDQLLEDLIDCGADFRYAGKQYEFSYAHAKVKAARDIIISAFNSKLETILQEFADGTLRQVQEPEHEDDQFSLIDQDSMDEQVLITTASQRALGRYATVLWSLDQRCAALNGEESIRTGENPVSPVQFCRALMEGMRRVDIDASIKPEVFRVFEHAFLAELDPMYSKLNESLKEMGVLPKLRHGVVKSGRGGRSERTSAGDHQGEAGDGWLGGRRSREPSDVADYQRSLFESIWALQAQIPAVQGLVPATAAPVQYQPMDLLQVLTQLQQLNSGQLQSLPVAPTAGVAPQQISQVNDQLLEKLGQLTGSDTPVQLAQRDTQTIDLVGMLFEYLLNDEHLPDGVKALLSYLHTPMLKLAFSDLEFFSQPEHPARKLLDRLAEVGSTWVSNGGNDQQGVYVRMRELVDRLLKNTGDDVRPYTEELLAFNTFMKRLELKAQMMEKRVAEQAQGEDRLQLVKHRVHSELSERIGDRELPSAVLMFLLQPWSDYMALVLLRWGDEGAEWRDSTAVVDELLWGLDITSGDEKNRWQQGHESLQKRIQQGFDAIGFEEAKRRTMSSALEYVYTLKMQDQVARPAPKQVHHKLHQLAERNAGVIKVGETLSSAEQQHLQQLKEIPFGTWFERDDGRREKVVWYNLRTMQFLFVDQSGHRSGMRSGEDIARLLENGSMRIIQVAEKPLMERTLERIYADLCERTNQSKAEQ